MPELAMAKGVIVRRFSAEAIQSEHGARFWIASLALAMTGDHE
jgi:hypothetical protein